MEVICIDDSDDDEGSSLNNHNDRSNNVAVAAAANNTNTNINDDNDSSRPERAVPNIYDDNEHEYRVMMLMDHREFGQRTREVRNYLHEVESRINRRFNGTYCEILSLKAADYMFAARKISRSTGQVVEERLFDLIIERKDVGDLASCLINKSKDFKPLSFFEAQMHKLVHCGIDRKIFLVEGDEDTFQWRTEGGGPASEDEKRKRRLRIKTTRLLVEHGRFRGVELVCTKFKDRTIQFLIYQMELLQNSFDPKDFAGMKTMQQFTDHIKEKMNDPTYRKYLALRNQHGVGDKKAMKVIRDPNENWDKSFVSPSEKNEDIKSTMEDRATYWSRSSARRQERDAAAQPQPPPPGAGAGNDQRNSTSNNRIPTVDRSASNVSSSSSSSAASSNDSSNVGATASSASSHGSANSRANAKATGKESKGKKRDATKKTPYKKRQKVSEKLYIQRKPSNLKPSHSTPTESVSQNGYIPANPLHETKNSSLVAALLDDDRKPAAKSSKGRKDESVRSRQPCAVQSGSKSGSGEFNYMLELSDDDIEGQVVAVPKPRSKQNTKSVVEDVASTGNDAQNKGDASSTNKSAGKTSWYDDYKDVLESSDDDSVASVKKPAVCKNKSKQGCAKKASDNDVIDLIDEDDESVGSVIELLD